MLKRLFSYKNPNSYVNWLRNKRFQTFQRWALGMQFPSDIPVRILDLGGTYHYWRHIRDVIQLRCRVTLLNLKKGSVPPDQDWIESIQGDVLKMEASQFKEYDLIFSNSLIEHLGSKKAMLEMARNIRRSGLPYYIQTPNYWFPLEPHCRIPFFQFLPRNIRAWLIYHYKITYFPSAETYEQCKKVSDSTILLRKSELAELFPDGRIVTERLFGLPKSCAVFYP
jgi:hypothetical protein